jgi:hypothetical protein
MRPVSSRLHHRIVDIPYKHRSFLLSVFSIIALFARPANHISGNHSSLPSVSLIHNPK